MVFFKIKQSNLKCFTLHWIALLYTNKKNEACVTGFFFSQWFFYDIFCGSSGLFHKSDLHTGPKTWQCYSSQSTVAVFVLISESSQNRQQRKLSELARCKFWWNVPLALAKIYTPSLHLQHELSNEDGDAKQALVTGGGALLHVCTQSPIVP